jgi:nucleoside-diphosphate-sugar epimerase
MNKILITGSTGFIGRRLINAVDGKVQVLSRIKQPGYDTIVCNLERELIPDNAVSNINTVFHLAGFAHDVRDASKINDLYQKVNVEATVQLANLAVESGVKRFVFVSSVKAGGGVTPDKCINEANQGEPEGVYGKTKREAELALLEIGKNSNMHVSIIRPSLVYGPDVKGNLKLMLSYIKKGRFPPLPETGNKRSMIHVDDLVKAILLVARDNRTNGEIFIATDGVPHSSREIYEAMCSVTHKSVPKWSIPKFVFDMFSVISPKIRYKVDKLLGDECYSSKKLESLGFSAQRTLKEMNETSF